MNFYIDVGNNGPDVSEDTKLTFSTEARPVYFGTKLNTVK